MLFATSRKNEISCNIHSVKEFTELAQNARFEAERYSPKYSEKFPKCWQAAVGKRYMLPAHIQKEYVNQEAANYVFLREFIQTYQNLRDAHRDGTTIDPSESIYMMSTLLALNYERPTYFLTRKQGEAFLKTDPLPDLVIDDINWIFPHLRVYLPLNLVTYIDDGQLLSVLWVEVFEINGEPVAFPDSLFKELTAKLKREEIGYNSMGPELPDKAFGLVARMSDGSRMRVIVFYNETDTFNNKFTFSGKYKAPAEQLGSLAIVLLTYLSSYPPENTAPAPLPEEIIRRPKQEGKNLKVGLYHPRFIDEKSYLAAHPRQTSHSEPTGKHIAGHWRRGHFKRQVFGVKRGQRHIIWIQPYYAGKPEEEAA